MAANLQKQLKELSKIPNPAFSAGLTEENDIFKWQVLILGPPDSLYEGGCFQAQLEFPCDYPNMPPTLRFVTEMWHPNVYKDGTVCISILHPPQDDEFGYEKASERWLPVHSVESILLSVISLLAAPNIDSPANIDAANQCKNSPREFKRQVQAIVRASQNLF